MSIITSGDSRIKRLEINNENGEHIGELVFNPYDLNSLEKFWGIYDKMNKGSKRQAELEIELNQLDKSIMDKDLETIEEFEKAEKIISKTNESILASFDTFDDVVKGLDDIFGVGICQLFIKGYRDEGMLMPLIDGVMPYFEEAHKERRKKVDEGKLNREQRRAAAKQKQ